MTPENGKIFDRIWSEGAKAVPRMSFSEALSAFADAVRVEERARAGVITPAMIQAAQDRDDWMEEEDLYASIYRAMRAASYIADDAKGEG